MINHVRTLLANVTGGATAVSTSAGEEIIDPSFAAIPDTRMTPVLKRVRASLFGTNPDWLMLDYRLAQYMRILHASGLAGDVISKDGRITYSPDGSDLDDLYRHQVVVTPTVNTVWTPARPITVLNPNAVTLNDNRLHRLYRVKFVKLTPTKTVSVIDLEGEKTYSESFGLGVDTWTIVVPNTNVSLIVPTDTSLTVTYYWDMVIYARPNANLADVITSLSFLDGRDGEELFRDLPDYLSIWSRSDEPANRLAAVLLATAERMEEAKNQ